MKNRIINYTKYILFVYLLLYLILMDPFQPAMDSPRNVVFNSAYRWAPVCVDQDGDARVWFKAPHSFNYLFLPLDKIKDLFWKPSVVLAERPSEK